MPTPPIWIWRPVRNGYHKYLIRRGFLQRLAALAALPGLPAAPLFAQPALRAEYEAFASELAAKHGLDAQALRRLFAQIKPQPSIIRAMNAPSTALPWHAFRRGRVDAVRINGGVKFWHQHAATLAYEAMPANLVTMLKQCVLDTLGVTIGASGLADEAKILADYVGELGGSTRVPPSRPARRPACRNHADAG